MQIYSNQTIQWQQLWHHLARHVQPVEVTYFSNLNTEQHTDTRGLIRVNTVKHIYIGTFSVLKKQEQFNTNPKWHYLKTNCETNQKLQYSSICFPHLLSARFLLLNMFYIMDYEQKKSLTSCLCRWQQGSLSTFLFLITNSSKAEHTGHNWHNKIKWSFTLFWKSTWILIQIVQLFFF